MTRVAAAVARASAAAAEHPRHVLLAAVAVGLACSGLTTILAGGVAWSVAVVARSLPLVPTRKAAAGLGALVVLAAMVGHARWQAVEHTHLRALMGTTIDGDATVLTAPRADAFGGQRALVRWRGEQVLLRVPSWTRMRRAGVGDIVRVAGRVTPPDRSAQALRATATLRASRVTPTGRRRSGLLGRVDDIRRRAMAAFAAGLPRTEAALMAGMALGQDEQLPSDTRDAFRAAGLSHLVAASGQNVMLLVALALALSMAVGIGFVARWIFVLALIALYVPLAGGTAPIERAGVAGAAMVVATLAGRPASRWYAVLLGLVATLALDPRNISAVGWQLSFAAVAGIAVLAGPARDGLEARGVPRTLAEAVAVTAAATVVTAPIMSAHFGRVSVVALPANVLAAPAVPLVMWLGMTAAALAQVWAAGCSAVAGLAALPLGFLVAVARTASRVPGAEVAAPVAVVAVLAVAAAVILASAASRSQGGSPAIARRRILALAAAAAAALLVALRSGHASPAPLVPQELRVTALDVGQGDATLLQVPGHAVLVDAGPVGAPVVPELRRAGVDRLDALIVSHPQADHDGGAPAVLGALPVTMLLDGRAGDRSATSLALDGPLRRQGTRVIPAEAGQALHAGSLDVEILWPPAGHAPAGEDPNDRAVVAEASAFGSRALLTADAESPVLAPLDLEPVDLLKISHHGSADPGLPGLLGVLRPRVAVIEVGRGNSYGHPAPTTMQALRSAVPTIRRTDLDGTVRVDLVHGAVREVVTE